MKTATRYTANYGTALPIAIVCGAVFFNAIYLLAVGSVMSKRKDAAVTVESRPVVQAGDRSVVPSSLDQRR